MGRDSLEDKDQERTIVFGGRNGMFLRERTTNDVPEKIKHFKQCSGVINYSS
jgi:hypothetical protein